MRPNVGNKIMCVNVAPYHRFLGHSDKLPKFIELEVIEKKENVPYDYGDKTGEGFLAKGSDGHLYGYDYPRVGCGLGNTSWVRYCPDEEFEKLTEEEKDILVKDMLWIDVTLFQCPKPVKRFVDTEYIQFCESHQRHFYTVCGCVYCKHDLPKPEITLNIAQHRWVGWYDE